MACMEHECRGCQRVWFDNVRYYDSCPKCGCEYVASFFDEEPDFDDYDGYRDDDE